MKQALAAIGPGTLVAGIAVAVEAEERTFQKIQPAMEWVMSTAYKLNLVIQSYARKFVTV